MRVHKEYKKKEDKNKMDPETCDTILDAAKSVYYEDQALFVHTETKTNTVLTFVGVVFAGCVLLFSEYKPELTYYRIIFWILIIQSFIATIFFLLSALRTETFIQVKLDSIVTEEQSYVNSAIVRFRLAKTFQKARNDNKLILTNKLKKY